MFQTCFVIFIARVCDVSLGTLRTVYAVKGRKYLAAVIAFFEIIIWFLVAKEALNTTSTSLWIPISYSLGYATGTLLGTVISDKFVSGKVTIHIVTKKNHKTLIEAIRNKGYGVTILPLENYYDEIKKEMLIIQVNKKHQKDVIRLIKRKDATAFITINETKLTQNGYIK